MAPPSEIDLFLQLSEVLTGAGDLDANLAGEYLARLRKEYPKEVSDLVAAFSEIASVAGPHAYNFVDDVRSKIVENARLALIVQHVITIWYTAQFTGPDGKLRGADTPEQFYAGLLWSVIHAHAPTHPTEPFGSWHDYPKEER